jgi:hypothetical protein
VALHFQLTDTKDRAATEFQQKEAAPLTATPALEKVKDRLRRSWTAASTLDRQKVIERAWKEPGRWPRLSALMAVLWPLAGGERQFTQRVAGELSAMWCKLGPYGPVITEELTPIDMAGIRWPGTKETPDRSLFGSKEDAASRSAAILLYNCLRGTNL